MRFACLFLLFGFLYMLPAQAQQMERFRFLARDKVIRPHFLDPYDAQSQIALFPYLKNGQEVIEGAYTPAIIGFYRNLLNGEWNGRKIEVGAEAAAFAQLELGKGTNTRFWTLFNTDYKFGINAAMAWQKGWMLRARLFHLSSHLGDDFVLRNRINGFREGEISYEQLDLIASRKTKSWNAYAGVGLVVRSYTPREPLSLWGGSTFSFPAGKTLAYCGGIHVHSRAINQFTPSFKAALGISFRRDGWTPFRLVLEGFSGFLPYSWYEFSRTQWAGLSLYIDPF